MTFFDARRARASLALQRHLGKDQTVWQYLSQPSHPGGENLLARLPPDVAFMLRETFQLKYDAVCQACWRLKNVVEAYGHAYGDGACKFWVLAMHKTAALCPSCAQIVMRAKDGAAGLANSIQELADYSDNARTRLVTLVNRIRRESNGVARRKNSNPNARIQNRTMLTMVRLPNEQGNTAKKRTNGDSTNQACKKQKGK